MTCKLADLTHLDIGRIYMYILYLKSSSPEFLNSRQVQEKFFLQNSTQGVPAWHNFLSQFIIIFGQRVVQDHVCYIIQFPHP